MTSASLPHGPGSMAPAWPRYMHLPALLTTNKAHDTPELSKVLELLVRSGGVPFEVISGAPSDVYGSRITVSTGGSKECAEIAGFEGHACGIPDWIGVRTIDGQARWKAYHRANAHTDLGCPRLPDALASCAVPVMVARSGASLEVYWRLLGDLQWPGFLALALRDLGVEASAVTSPGLAPRPVPGAFCISHEYTDQRLDAVTLYASDRAFPADADIPEIWEPGLTPADVLAYRAALDAVRSVGPRPRRGFHAMVAWKFGREGPIGRAVSLRVPRPSL